MSDYGIRADPHIYSRIKTLKPHFGIVYDMLYGSTSGFGWDPIRKCVVAEKHVWDSYLHVLKHVLKHLVTRMLLHSRTNHFATSMNLLSFLEWIVPIEVMSSWAVILKMILLTTIQHLFPSLLLKEAHQREEHLAASEKLPKMPNWLRY